MRDYLGFRVHLAVKRRVSAALRSLLVLRVRLRPAPRPATVTGTVVLLDRCLGLGDALMISPILGLLTPLGPVTVVTALPPLLDWEGSWQTCPDWGAMIATVRRLTSEGRLLLVPRLGVGGLVQLLRWPGPLPAGVISLSPDAWLDTAAGDCGAIARRHYTDGALACAQALLTGNDGRERPALRADAVPRVPPVRAPSSWRLPEEKILVALAPWATSRIRRWPPGHWSRLIGRLAHANPALLFALMGSAAERPAGDAIIEGLAPGTALPVVNLMGKLSLAETADVLGRAALLVACDNGLMHLGLGVETPLVAIFGSTDPAARLIGRRWRLAADPGLCPHRRAPCYPDLHRDPSCPTAAECLSGLHPDHVADLALDLLTTAPEAQP